MTFDLSQVWSVIVLGEAMIELSNVSGRSASIGVAGDTYNTSVYLARAGVKTYFSSALGCDTFSRRIQKQLTLEGIQSDLLVYLESKVPGLYAIETDEVGERSFLYWRSDSAARYFFDAPNVEIILDRLEQAPLLYLSGITLSIFDKSARAKLVRLLSRVRANGGYVVFDTNYRPNGWASHSEALGAIKKVMPYVSLALPTLEDDVNLFGVSTVQESNNRWLDAGAAEVVVKDGAQGAFLSEGGWVSPPENIAPVDTTGAGDSFNGAYLAARLKGLSPVDSALQAHKLAAKVIQVPGAILPIS